MASLRGLGMGAASRQGLLLHNVKHQSLSRRHAGAPKNVKHTHEHPTNTSMLHMRMVQA